MLVIAGAKVMIVPDEAPVSRLDKVPGLPSSKAFVTLRVVTGVTVKEIPAPPVPW
jgi:hypothetical protein